MTTDFFKANRDSIASQLKGGLIVASAYAGMQRGNDTAFKFEQEANFWWLTGIEVPDWWVIIDGTRGKSWLVAPSLSDSRVIFDGSLSVEDAIKASGVDAVISRDDALMMLRTLAKKHSVVHTIGEQPYAEYLDFTLNPAAKKLHELLERTFNSVSDCRKELASLRAIKQPEEIAAMKQAINLTISAFENVRNNLDQFTYEYEVEAEFSYVFKKQGAAGHAYDPIVAFGSNACTLHYIDNNSRLKKRSLLLLDIGARMSGYAADITRTYALGEPTKRQMAVHQAVQAAQQKIIRLIKPDLLVEEYQQKVDAIMTDALLSLALMKSRDDEKNYRKYFPHAVSHGLGIDVHDSLGQPKYLRPGMVLTVEPGIYIPEEGIGVRIEDDILVTGKGHTNLTARLSTDL
ncbi:MAG TPA: Xaa-Pro aminopeptidase [Candidatus Saccharimonadales bacterium]|nr:Xaa-Pro aminopeptidase [Candidatus Saccharimonadales bacterium]